MIVVHAAYVGVVRPRAMPSSPSKRRQCKKTSRPLANESIYVLIYDWEQEAEIILALWAFAIMGFKWMMILRQQALLNQDFIPWRRACAFCRRTPRPSWPARSRPCRNSSVVRFCRDPAAGLSAFHTPAACRMCQRRSSYCDAEGARLESELSMIGTSPGPFLQLVPGHRAGHRGALNQAPPAIEGDIFGVTRSLEWPLITLIALLVSCADVHPSPAQLRSGALHPRSACSISRAV